MRLRFDAPVLVLALAATFGLTEEKPAKEMPASNDAKLTAAGSEEKFKLTELEQEVLDWTNAQRKAAGLQPLVASEKLTKAARAHAWNMASYQTLSHSLGGDVSSRVMAYGYTWWRLAENIAAGQTSAQDVISSWMGSSGHRANILGNFTEIGIGAADAGVGGTRYWAQIFGTPGG